MPLDLDRPVRDTLVLDTVRGAVDHLAQELRELVPEQARIVRRGPDHVVVDYAGPLRPLAAARLYSRCAVALDALPDGSWPRLDESLRTGVLGALPTPVRFRVAPLGDRRWPVRDLLRDRYGWVNDPSGWDVNVEYRHDVPRAEIGPLYLTRRFGELARLPASTTPVVAALLCRLAKIGPDDTVLDPVCGAGTLLVTAAEAAGARHLAGADLDPRAVRAARDNLARRGLPAAAVVRADATRLPLPDGSVDRVVANLPFGKRVGSHRGNATLYPGLLRELTRVLTRQGRAVLLTEDKALLRQSVQRTPHLHVVRELVLETGGAHPSAFVLTRTRGRR
ncbi:MAG: TRM11 family SAM-dependent methyltransferase [Mycobacteriales bacterium]